MTAAAAIPQGVSVPSGHVAPSLAVVNAAYDGWMDAKPFGYCRLRIAGIEHCSDLFDFLNVELLSRPILRNLVFDVVSIRA